MVHAMACIRHGEGCTMRLVSSIHHLVVMASVSTCSIIACLLCLWPPCTRHPSHQPMHGGYGTFSLAWPRLSHTC